MEERQKLKHRMKSVDLGSTTVLARAPPPPPLPPPPTTSAPQLKITKPSKPSDIPDNAPSMDMMVAIKSKAFKLKHVNSVDKVCFIEKFSFKSFNIFHNLSPDSSPPVVFPSALI